MDGSMSYKGLDDDDKVELISEINQNNNNCYNVVSDYKSNEIKETFLTKMLTRMLKQLSRPHSIHIWQMPQESCKLSTMMMPINFKREMKKHIKFFNWLSSHCYGGQGQQANRGSALDIQHHQRIILITNHKENGQRSFEKSLGIWRKHRCGERCRKYVSRLQIPLKNGFWN